MDSARRIAGFTSLSGGVNGGIDPNLIGPDQLAIAVNTTFRGDFVTTRPSWANNVLSNAPSSWTGIFQGSMHYDGEAGQSGWLVARGGRFFFITDDTFNVSEITAQLVIVTTGDFTLPGAGNQVLVNINGNPPLVAGNTVTFGAIHYTVVAVFVDQIRLTQVTAGAGTVKAGTPMFDATGTNQIIEFEVYPSTLNFVFMFQAENYGIILGGQERTLIFDGKQITPAPLSGGVPSGFLGAYGWGRIWITRPDRRTFVAGNLVFDPSGGGTPALNFRDSILNFTDNNFLNGGGAFGVPYNAGPITSMQFLATQDTSLGIGVLLVGTTNMVFSVNAPVDRTIWQNLSYPIQTVSLIDYGPLSPRGTVSVNGDMWYRSQDGIRSFIVARRLFGNPGNTPMSHEVDFILGNDTDSLLFFGSGMLFDNRLYMTVSPFTANGQVEHRGLVAINFDLVSTLKTKQSPSWEGLFTGLNILQIGKCRIADEERGFMFVQGATDIELWEILEDGIADGFSTVAGGRTILNTNGISSMIQTRSEDYGTPLELKRLIMAELYIEDIADTVTCSIFYQPDQFCGWIPWTSFTLCSVTSQCTPSTNPCIFQVNARSYAARLTIPQPADLCNTMTGKPSREFHECQFKLAWTGHWRIRKFFTHVKLQTQPTEGICPPTVTCVAFPCCADNLFLYDSHSAGLKFIAGEGLGEPILGEGGEMLLGE